MHRFSASRAERCNFATTSLIFANRVFYSEKRLVNCRQNCAIAFLRADLTQAFLSCLAPENGLKIQLTHFKSAARHAIGCGRSGTVLQI